MAEVIKYSEKEAAWQKLEIREKNELQLARGFQVADMYLNRTYLDSFSSAEILEPDKKIINSTNIRIIEISKLVLDVKEKVTDKLMSVYSALYSLKSTVGLIIDSDGRSIHFYMGIRSEQAAGSAGELLESTLKGNFPGIEYKTISHAAKDEILEAIKNTNAKSLAAVSIVPSMRDEDQDMESFVQGIEKFIDSMNGKSYTMISLAVPLNRYAIEQSKHGYEELYSALTPHAKLSVSYGRNESIAINKSISSNFTKSVNRSVTNSNTQNRSSSHGTNSGYSSGNSSNSGFSWDGMSFGGGSNSSSSNGSFSSYTSGVAFTEAIADSEGTSQGEGMQEGTSETEGSSKTIGLSYENKGVSSLMKRAEAQLERFKLCESYGMWEFAAYFMSADSNTTALAASTYKALMTGHKSNVESAHINFWPISQRVNIKRVVDCAAHFVHPLAKMPAFDEFSSQFLTPAVLVSGNELPIVMGMPKKSVSGLAVIQMAEFGRAVVYENKKPKRAIDFGCIYHMGVEEKDSRVNMDLDLLSSHCFITGSPGSGKSYATYQLLDRVLNQDVRIMIIEPAKGEYKQIFGGLKGIKIFTTDPNAYRLLRINPFQFPDSIHILSHIEQLIQIFNASWPLYAAMPAILKQAVVDSYIKCGWDVQNSIWIPGLSDHKYPVFRDVLEVLPGIINTSDYSADSKGDYKGALLTRVQSMTTGITGMIFKNSEGVDDSQLFESNVIIDLSELGSDEAIALIMGILIMKLNEYRKAQRKTGSRGNLNSQLKHVTVLEEAHNLLKRTSKDQNQEDANMVGKSVEMISNSIKEMRTYGEGFIIIDQSPMAVDASAIENTSTKIIMNTPAKDACEELGSALSLTDEQTRELSRLNVGVAAVFQKGWLSPVLMKVDEWDNRYEKSVVMTDTADLRVLKGEILTILIEQKRRKRFSSMEIRNIIKSSCIPDDKKREFTELIRPYADQFPMGETFDRSCFGNLLIDVCGCESLFQVIPLTDIPTYDQFASMDEEAEEFRYMLDAYRKNVSLWFETFYKALNLYASLDEEMTKAEIIVDMVYAVGKGGNYGRYRNDKLVMLCRMLFKEFDLSL